MKNLSAYLVMVVVLFAITAPMLVILLRSAMATGKIPVRHGGMFHRVRQPVGFWVVFTSCSATLALITFGAITALMEIFGLLPG
ncbi:MAG TPA: hypothetical protein VGM83_14890 [Devosiaceae bacterium]